MKEKIDINNFLSMIFLSTLSSSIGISLYITIKTSSIDAYISTLIGGIIGLIPIFIFIYLFNSYEDLSIKDKNYLLFNKMGYIINIILSILILIVTSTLLFNLSNFIVSQYLSNTPLILIMLIIGFTGAYTAGKGIETISKTSFIFMIIVIILFIFTFFHLSKEINMNNLKPFLEYGLKKPLLGGLLNSVIITYPLYALLIIPKNSITNKKKINRKIIYSYLLGLLIIFLITFFSISILGKYLLNIYQYPGYISIKKISVFSFVERIENFMSLHWILASFITISINVYYLSNNIKKVNKIYSYLLIIIIIFISYLSFKNNTHFTNYIYYIYPYISLFLLIIHLLIVFKIFMYKKKKNEYNISKQ